ncbi:actin-like ATPase domain-containing protein [Aspergillus eucalypticola CBS 122712]|uniref:Actin-like ATPase domain-containing protein n=1 Tax=Aspergillus eucalypticola (strain CBS 122712 / IBT 29274) TaxID=1448314 RepID=A0A317VKT2_ASPEC|nr:actin-like ATPase domain-containing protein [Aspergillus eucalypticola CBS 122712]PWY73462.1 actin-like ATPase domain-containing protein [Aspergillus eucalypticola CBS 122712]
MSNPRIVIGLDFGTTYSGVAWALRDCPDKPEVIMSWPGAGNRLWRRLIPTGTTPKVPSTMVIKCGGRVHWGYQTNYLIGDNIRGMKLLLDEPQNSGYVASLIDAGLLKRSRIPAVTLTGMYLTGLVDHTKKILQRRFGPAADQMEMKYVLTVPAIWSDKAKDATLKAASRAKIPQKDITLVSEPEAAALYCLNAIQPNSIENNDVVVVCDAGGGTVDLISYRVKTVSPLCLEEVSEGSGMLCLQPRRYLNRLTKAGDICGSVLLDAAFKSFLSVLVNDKHLSGKSSELALKYWQDQIKPNFASDPDFEEETHFVPLPGLKDNPKIGLQDGFLQLEGAQIKNIFDPVVDRVKVQIVHQVNSARAKNMPVKAILLVGGFGSSEYLYHCIQETFSDIVVMQPPNSWSAVMLGAVRYGLGGSQVTNRIARCHYGIRHETDNPQTMARFPEAKRFWDDLNERWYICDMIEWYIHKARKPIRMDFDTTLAVGRTPSITSRLNICLHSEAPERSDSSVYQLCTLTTDLSSVPTQYFTKHTNSKGTEYYTISHVMTMTPGSASIKFELELNGQSYGEVQATYFD